MKTYGQTIEWGGGYVSVFGFDTPEEATRAAIEMASEIGWSRPRWWQFWRWGEVYPK